jgi:hypothetical protein
MKLFLLCLVFSLACYASVDYIDVRDSLSKDPTKTVIVIGCTDGSVIQIPVDKNEPHIVKKYKINITKYCN